MSADKLVRDNIENRGRGHWRDNFKKDGLAVFGLQASFDLSVLCSFVFDKSRLAHVLCSFVFDIL